MTDEMIEAVAQAIREARNEAMGRTTPYPDHLSIIEARAAIAAHKSALAKAGLGIRPREPTAESIAEGVLFLVDANLDGPDGVGESDALGCWQAMWEHPDKPDG